MNVRKWMHLLIGIFLIFIFIFILIPCVQQEQSCEQMEEVTQRYALSTEALFYTESSAAMRAHFIRTKARERRAVFEQVLQ